MLVSEVNMADTYTIKDFINSGLVNYYNLNNIVTIYVGRRVFMADKLNLDDNDYKFLIAKLRNDLFTLLDMYLKKGTINKIYLDIRRNVGKISYKDNILYLTIEPEILEQFLWQTLGLYRLEDIAFNVLEDDKEFVNKVIKDYNKKRGL